MDSGTPFSELFGFLGPKNVYFVILDSNRLFLVIFGSEFGCLGLDNQAFGKGGIAKIDFERSWNSDDFMIDFV